MGQVVATNFLNERPAYDERVFFIVDGGAIKEGERIREDAEGMIYDIEGTILNEISLKGWFYRPVEVEEVNEVIV